MTGTRTWTAAGIAAVLAVFVLERFTPTSIALVPLLAAGPLIAAVGAARAQVTGVAVLAIALAGLELALDRPPFGQDFVRLLTVLLVSGLAVALAALREHLERSAAAAREAGRRAEETLAQLDVIFARAPVGLAFNDRDGRFVRINDRLAEINGRSPEAHVGRSLAEILPELPEAGAELRRVAETGRPSTDVELRGQTPAQPGVMREWVASYWPVRRGDGDEIIGVGTVVFDVTERRAAERALRTQTDRYETLLTALSEVGEGMVVIEDERCVYANPAFERLSGYAFPELAAMGSLFDLVEPAEREETRRRARARAELDLVESGYEVSMLRRDEGRVLLELAGVPLELAGPPARRQLVVVVRDVTARRRAEAERERLLRRSGLMAEASTLFDQELDEQRTLESVARLCVRDLADTCAVVLADRRGLVRHSLAVARDPGRDAAADPAAREPLVEVLRTGAPFAADRVLAVPLTARGHVLGALAAGFDALAHEDREETLAVLEDLGRRAAVALDSSRLYEERAEIARTLQRSLLPPELPSIPGVQVAARYLAAGEGMELGGDFYDCFATGGGDWALVIGDVCGKGAEAAAITALARYTLRAAVLHTRRPARVLEALNEALLRQGMDYRFCTVLYAAVTPRADGCDVVVATGGHPLPLVLRADGAVDIAGSPGTLLGVVPDPAISEAPIHLGPGDALVLYTDGVVDTGTDAEALGTERLAELLGSWAGRDAGRIAAAIEREALAVQDGRMRDDVAVVVLQVRPGGGEVPFGAPGAGVARTT
jgi:PAS domain S-box-containing protein